MSITFFSKAVGQVAAFVDPTMPARLSVNVPGWGGFFGFESIITNIQVASQGNFQFLHTLGGNIFVYVFGDRIGQLSMSGLSFESTCEEPGGTIGIERVFAYYNANQIANLAIETSMSIHLFYE